MRIDHIAIDNFRGLGKITWTPEQAISVIAGPNAVGKTSIFEAIRLAVCILAPADPNEGIQALSTMGIASGHMTSVRYGSLAQDLTKPVEISLTIKLTNAEVGYLSGRAEDMALLRLRTILGIQQQLDLAALAQLLSQDAHRVTLT